MDKFNEGLDGELGIAENETETVGEKKPKRRPFHIWTVGGQDYKLKLNTQMIEALERKYRTNVLNLITVDGLPQLSVMLTVIQAAASPWNHGMNYERVKKLYDAWREEGGSQTDLLSNVLLPVMAVSGFFTEEQADSIMAELTKTGELL